MLFDGKTNTKYPRKAIGRDSGGITNDRGPTIKGISEKDVTNINREDKVRHSDTELEFHKLWKGQAAQYLDKRRPTAPPKESRDNQEEDYLPRKSQTELNDSELLKNVDNVLDSLNGEIEAPLDMIDSDSLMEFEETAQQYQAPPSSGGPVKMKSQFIKNNREALSPEEDNSQIRLSSEIQVQKDSVGGSTTQVIEMKSNTNSLGQSQTTMSVQIVSVSSDDTAF